MFEELRFDGPIIKVTISRTAHRWFVSITVETEDTEAVDTSTHPVIGIDVRINTLATLDNGKNPIIQDQRYERKLKRASRPLSKKKFLSNNWYKSKRTIGKIALSDCLSLSGCTLQGDYRDYQQCVSYLS